MVKVSSNDALAILRRFDHAGDEHYPRHVEQLQYHHPSATNTVISFRFLKQRFYIIFDDTAEDDTAYMLDELRLIKQDLNGEFIKNPHDSLMTYGLPFKGKDVYLFLEFSGKKRLDVELAERYADTSRSSWQKHIKAGHVAVNGTVQTSPKYEVTDVDVIAVSIPEKTDYSDHDFPIIYVDDEVVVIDKPAGVLTHSKGELNDEFTVADFFRRYTSYNLDTNRPGIIHRLDRDTSGVIIGARTEAAAQMLQKQFAERTVKKEYQAVVSGHPDPESAVIDLPIGRNPSAPSTFRVDPGGKTAQTTYETLQMGSGVTLVALRPKTGRTHQLRVHMQYIGTPIVGDKVYGTTPADRLYLHAHSLEVTIPGGERKVFTVPVPDSFEARVAE
jgi:23S rRNA pseudouridine1911/1915/1917 synthase